MLARTIDSTNVTNYAYDALDRLISADSGANSFSYDYDHNGNRLSREFNQDGEAYAYQDNSNRLASIEEISHALDGNGNTLSTNNSDGTQRNYTYDIYNRLTNVNGTEVTDSSYVYNALNQRVEKQTINDLTQYYYGPDGELLVELDENDVVQREYIYLNSELLSIIDYTTTQPNAESGLFYVHNDHLATPKVITDDQANIVWRSNSEPFGKTVVDEDVDGDGELISLNTRFPGQYYDDETGLHYNWNRYYDPGVGRYITVDPIGLMGGLNLFLYVEGNSLLLIDPSGFSGDVDIIDPNQDYEVDWAGTSTSIIEMCIIVKCNSGEEIKYDYTRPGELEEGWSNDPYAWEEEHAEYFRENLDQYRKLIESQIDSYCPPSL